MVLKRFRGRVNDALQIQRDPRMRRRFKRVLRYSDIWRANRMPNPRMCLATNREEVLVRRDVGDIHILALVHSLEAFAGSRVLLAHVNTRLSKHKATFPDRLAEISEIGNEVLPIVRCMADARSANMEVEANVTVVPFAVFLWCHIISLRLRFLLGLLCLLQLLLVLLEKSESSKDILSRGTSHLQILIFFAFWDVMMMFQRMDSRFRCRRLLRTAGWFQSFVLARIIRRCQHLILIICGPTRHFLRCCKD
mmetsp:Transcript_27434/g.62181  ORF Transcript_27434/g.62181 Transcript_27434/m.62181 type:complete len:251 (+) Transcript_27434:1453-2205(+)